ncbi:rRNA biogenesis protein rrp36 [Ophidiomyces ophidiicola]|nr:rRNA biogenesis protein rrp36 [Ophidiomyces ophidiicola]KAI1990292.1 rRNA biogenesis protein rrp36 [Ophidiomyces ophidiicola]KAI1990932.1 rRNA biogenesis protein rrp36 [Ophidiomyces ophidiicola]KAI1998096.1 rRNA biogenesis protein rrp36 [Ophidiomyces ophidiicola]
MGLTDSLNRRMKAQPDTADGHDSEILSESSSDDDGVDSGNAGSGADSEVSESEDSEGELRHSSPEHPDITSSLHEISFGALAKAQASLGRVGKQKPTLARETPRGPSALDEIRQRIGALREEKSATPSSKKTHALPHRSSKHAPAVQSSKYAVTRKRMVVDHGAGPPKARDPRFDTVVISHGASNSAAIGNAKAAANKNYAFLEDYRGSELASLKQQLTKTKNPLEKEQLKRTITSTADRMRAFERKEKEKEIVAQHKRKERELIRKGKKSAPYFLKKGDVKKEALKQRYEEMGARQRQKTIERRRKKVASRERKGMPDMRRAVED